MKTQALQALEYDRQRNGTFGFHNFSDAEIDSLIPRRPADSKRAEDAEHWFRHLAYQAQRGGDRVILSRHLPSVRKFMTLDADALAKVSRLEPAVRHLRKIPMSEWTDEDFLAKYELARAQFELTAGGRSDELRLGALDLGSTSLNLAATTVVGAVSAPAAAVASLSAFGVKLGSDLGHIRSVKRRQQALDAIIGSPQFEDSPYLQVQVVKIDNPDASDEELRLYFALTNLKAARRVGARAVQRTEDRAVVPRVERRDGQVFPLPEPVIAVVRKPARLRLAQRIAAVFTG